MIGYCLENAIRVENGHYNSHPNICHKLKIVYNLQIDSQSNDVLDAHAVDLLGNLHFYHNLGAKLTRTLITDLIICFCLFYWQLRPILPRLLPHKNSDTLVFIS